METQVVAMDAQPRPDKGLVDVSSSEQTIELDTIETSPPTSTETFTCFPELPTKLRLKIWKEALPGPRILELFYDCDFDDHALERTNVVIRANLAPPTALHVSRESRQVALKKYMRLGASYATCFTFIDPAKDTIYFPWSKNGVDQEAMVYSNVFSTEATLSIRYMAVDYRIWEIFGLNTLGYYPALKEFTLIFHENQRAEYDDGHEAWRMRQTDIDFIDTEDISDTGVVTEKLRAAREALRIWKLDFPTWSGSALSIKGKALMRGGRKCCSKQ